MRLVSYFFLYLIMSGLASCAASSSASKDSGKSYNEDLSAYRISYETAEEGADEPVAEPVGEINPSHDITNELDQTLNEIAENNKENNIVSGYTIQVYSGSSREAASQAKSLVYQVLPDSRPEIQYVQPSYKVKVGQFLKRLEAQKSYAMLQEEFPDAMIIPERIKVQ